MQRYYSTVYWHFTGSPKGVDWAKVTKPSDILADGQPKSDDEAVDILRKILQSQKLLAKARVQISTNLTTDPFCCVTDIPLKDLPSHSEYYGKAAIGFRASSIYNQFLPVLYVSMSFLPFVKLQLKKETRDTITYEVLAATGLLKVDDIKQLVEKRGMKAKIEQLDEDALKGPFLNYVKITDFSVAPEKTFYCEREWRKVGDFEFHPSNVEVIVVPEKYLGQMRKYLYEEIGWPGTVSLIAWELIERV